MYPVDKVERSLSSFFEPQGKEKDVFTRLFAKAWRGGETEVLPHHWWKGAKGEEKETYKKYLHIIEETIPASLKNNELTLPEVIRLNALTKQIFDVIHERVASGKASAEEKKLQQTLTVYSEDIEEKEKKLLLSLGDELGLEELSEESSLEALQEKILPSLRERGENLCDMQRSVLKQAAARGEWGENIQEIENSLEHLSNKMKAASSCEKLLQIEEEISQISNQLVELQRLGLALSDTQREKEELLESYRATCERLGRLISQPLGELESEFEQLEDLSKLQVSTDKKAKEALAQWKEQISALQKRILEAAFVSAKKLPPPERRNMMLLAVPFGQEALKVENFVKEHFDEIVAKSIASGRAEKIKLMEGERKIAVLRTFVEEGERKVVILCPLGKGQAKSIKLGVGLVGEEEPLMVIARPQKKKGFPAEKAFQNELWAENHLRDTHLPYVITMRSICDLEGGFFGLLLEYCDGGDLEKEIKRIGGKKEAESCGLQIQYAFEFAVALKGVHEQKLAHLDIKGENILFRKVDGKRQVRLSDFGTSRRIGGKALGPIGTTPYCAPEMYQNEPWEVTGAQDMWSYGMLMVDLFCGKEANVLARVMNDPQFLSLSWNEKRVLIEEAREKTMAFVREKHLPTKIEESLIGLLEMDPRKRLSAEQIVGRLGSLTE